MKISMAVAGSRRERGFAWQCLRPEQKVTLAFERTPAGPGHCDSRSGQGLDTSKIPDPLAPDNLMKTSGRGIFLMRSFMDVVEIHPSQTGTDLE